MKTTGLHISRADDIRNMQCTYVLDEVILWDMAWIRDPGWYICWFFMNGLFLAVSLVEHHVQCLSGQLVNLTGMAVSNMFVDWRWLFEWLSTAVPKSWWAVFTGWKNFLGCHKFCKSLNTIGKVLVLNTTIIISISVTYNDHCTHHFLDMRVQFPCCWKVWFVCFMDLWTKTLNVQINKHTCHYNYDTDLQ